jgi:hypothetical protein
MTEDKILNYFLIKSLFFILKNILRDSADKIGQPSDYYSNGYSTKFGYGRVNADKAVMMTMGL